MHKQFGCEFLFPIYLDLGKLPVTKGMGMLVASDNGVYLLPRTHDSAGLTPTNEENKSGTYIALAAECDHVVWHRRLGYLNMKSLRAHQSKSTPYVPAMPLLCN
jgi:hypothetical protein